MEMAIKFSIVITTYNRLEALKYTLKSLSSLYQRDDVELLICDDASTDGTPDYLRELYSSHTLLLNLEGKGYIFNRNRLNNLAQGDYIISLDDDANFLSDNSLAAIEDLFINNPRCGLQALRIFWGLESPKTLTHNASIEQVRGFVGCGHVWRKTAWKQLPDYPEWFVFYGEEEFASYMLYKYHWKVLYNPNVLVHHRVSVKQRKTQKDYRIRLRRSLRSGWYLYGLFFPLREIPRRFLYTLWVQLKKKTFKGDVKATIGIFQALIDVLLHIPKLIKNSNRLTQKEFKLYQELPETKLFWYPNKD
ncbi:glycosyltransferase family 2 protein [Mesoflavibacter sp. SCSIO 43206]|nr:glycosyltransferase family 2 protein [Mesoflavibacter sp. SCSIO 43206]